MVAGSYRVAGTVMGQALEGTVTYEVAGTSLTGIIEGMGMQIPIQNGTADGNRLSHTCMVDTPIGKVKVGVDGTVTQDALTINLRWPFGGTTLTGTRI